MNGIRMIKTNDIEQSKSIAKEFIGIPVIGKEGELLNGVHKFKFGKVDATVRFVNGFIDGNVYACDKKILSVEPAIEYDSGVEYWTHGKPHGFPAISRYFGFYEENWYNGKLLGIREEVDISIE